ncbi:MAG: tetratricopeptide repeat protein [Gemmatimonadales bacterium]
MRAPAPFTDGRVAAAVVAILAVVVAASTLGNGFTLDDVPIIASNARVHSLASFGSLFSQTYWPPSEGASLYRPLTMAWFTLQWVIGGGSPLVFHIVSMLLYAAACVSFYLLAAELIPVGAAFAAAAFFAVHPVHVEVFANVVGQPEMWVAIIAFLATRHYVTRRRAGTYSGGDSAKLVAAFFVACLFKEHAIILPALFVAAELTLVRQPVQERIKTLAPFFFLLLVAGATFVFLRTGVIGRFAGAGQNGLLSISSLDVRIWTALSIVLEWLRLLMWPAVLSADYSYQRLDISPSFEPVMLLSVLVIVVAPALAWRVRREHEGFAFGMAWAFVSLILPSNLLIVTGFMLAERALFLASAGFLICVAAAGAHLWKLASARDERMRQVFAALCIVLLGAGALRSFTRGPVWKDNGTLFKQTVNDVPLSYRAHWMLAEYLLKDGPNANGLDEMLLAVGLARRNDSYVLAFAADRFREAGKCGPALGMYHKALGIRPEASDARIGAAACLVTQGRIREAQNVALEGLKMRKPEPILASIVAYTDSVLRSRDRALVPPAPNVLPGN